jgi:ABC-type transport system involved in multi-copper enzyme maturation permease subunit
LRGAVIVAGYAMQESVRRRVFPVVLVLTGAFLGLYGFGTCKAYQSIDPFSTESLDGGALVDTQVLFSATLFGLSIFAVLFLGTVLAIFLTHAVVRGDAERGLLQPLVVRPVGRAALLAGRFGAAALVCAVYVLLVYTASLLITHWVTGWWPDQIFLPAIELAVAVAVIVAISLFGSIVLSAIANGIAIFMVFGAGLVAGLLGQIGEALNSDSLNTIANVASWALPFEALYQDALNRITADTAGFTKAALSLGPFGGAQPAGAWLYPYVVGYFAVLAAIGLWAFNRKDL